MKVAAYIAVVLALVLIESVFVATEIALISLRDSQVRGLATKGRRGAAVAHLTADPNRFLAGVQIGVTLTSLLSSAYGAVTLSASAASGLRDAGMHSRPAGILGFLLVTLSISYVTLVLGELVPKRLALQNAERAAQLAAPCCATSWRTTAAIPTRPARQSAKKNYAGSLRRTSRSAVTNAG